jgi:hypothetical protein
MIWIDILAIISGSLRYGEDVKARRPVRVQEEPERSEDLMAGLLARIGGSGRGLEYRVFDAYSKVAGAMLAARSTPDSFRDGTLFVRTTSAALAHEITLLRAELVARMTDVLGPGLVRDVRTRVGATAGAVRR